MRVCRSYTDHPSETLWKNNGDEYACPFFDIRSDNRRLFDGLEIIYDEALCSAWMNLFKELKSGSAGKIQVGQSLHTMSTALKDNTTLRFAVITGCLKIAKESIFTGTNNFVSDNITDSRFNEYF